MQAELVCFALRETRDRSGEKPLFPRSCAQATAVLAPDFPAVAADALAVKDTITQEPNFWGLDAVHLQAAL